MPRRKLPKAAESPPVPHPSELEVSDLVLFLAGWMEPIPGRERAIKTEAQFHRFLKRYGADAHRWKDDPPRDGYDLALELARIDAPAGEETPPWLT